MRFLFPDSQDQIDPTFSFETEEREATRVRQRDDLYAHEVLAARPYDGMLVSKAIVDGIAGAARYTFAQRHRLYRLGARRFFRLERPGWPRLTTLGDCGAFTYHAEPEPPFTVDEVIDFYDGCGFDAGISLDHVILGYRDDAGRLVADEPPAEWIERQLLTLEFAGEFLMRQRARRCSFEPLGVAQGWSPSSYADAVSRLQDIGYDRIALGGMVPLKTAQILDCLHAIDDVRHPTTQLHLLGVTRTEHVQTFARYGVTSFDSTSPFRQAFKDADDNYYATGRTYSAVRVPQVGANTKLKKRILSGEVAQRDALTRERDCLSRLAAFDRDQTGVDEVIEAVAAYDAVSGFKNDLSRCRETLAERPWRTCGCGICGESGINVVIFRGTERNKRRGFHNLHVFNETLAGRLESGAREMEVPA